jgi:hypothetical protein
MTDIETSEELNKNKLNGALLHLNYKTDTKGSEIIDKYLEISKDKDQNEEFRFRDKLGKLDFLREYNKEKDRNNFLVNVQINIKNDTRCKDLKDYYNKINRLEVSELLKILDYYGINIKSSYYKHFGNLLLNDDNDDKEVRQYYNWYLKYDKKPDVNCESILNNQNITIEEKQTQLEDAKCIGKMNQEYMTYLYKMNKSKTLEDEIEKK